MSNERNVEASGCDASIMRNVWEIRERDFEQKMQMEQERIEKSALPTINKDWASRLAARQGNYKRPERKPKPVEDKVDENNVWKTKKAQVPPPVPRGAGSGPLGRPGVQSRGLSTPSTTKKDNKLPEKGLMKLQLLMFINQTQPSAMVWGKSWKYNKSLPLPAEGTEARSDWGHCWMFATQQPYTEAGQPWKNGRNMMDPNSLHFWEKLETRVVESQELDLSLPAEEWQVSWRKSDKTNKGTSSVDGENLAKSGWFKLLEETQRYNEDLCSSEWNESWRSTKPGSQQDNFTAPNNGLTNKSKQNNNKEMSSLLEDWKLANHLGRNNFKTPQNTKSLSSAWVDSWRAAITVFNNHKNSNASTKQGDTYDHNDQQRESNHHKVILVPHEQKNKNLNMQLWEEFEALAEWTKSWQVTKNNSKPCEEIEKVLKLSQVTASEAQKVESKTKGNSSTSGNVDPRYEQLKHSTIYHPRREFAQSQLLRMKDLGNDSSTPEWKDSWKTVKHRMRMERRRYRPDPSSPFRGAERGGDIEPAASEWTNSWKFTCQPLRQEPEAWQQGWTTTPQVRVDRARELNHFAPVELPKNGPTTERTWEQSWRFSRGQRQSQPGDVRAQTSQGSSSETSHHPDNSWHQRRYRRSVSDWQDAWMVSETQFRQDRPSLTQWREAWQWSVYHTDRWTEQVPRENRLDALMEIQPQRDWMSMQRAQTKMSRSFDTKMFREHYPEKEWNDSWKAGPLLSHTPSISGSSGEKTMSSNIQQHHGTTNGHGSKWGRSFRIANPMPQVEQPWVESSPNTSYYTVMWFREMNTQNKINSKFSNNPANFSQWGPSHRFLQGASVKSKDKTKSKVTVDPMVIVTKHISTRKHLYSNIEKEKQGDKKWAGCHLLGKTQPRPKRGPASKNTLNKTDENNDKIFEEWAESWRFLVKPGTLKNPVKSLKGWNESWKFLIPPYPPMNGHKTR